MRVSISVGTTNNNKELYSLVENIDFSLLYCMDKSYPTKILFSNPKTYEENLLNNFPIMFKHVLENL